MHLVMKQNFSERYARQTALLEVGAEGQQRLGSSHVLVIGAGGLGCPVLQYLCAAGVGHISVVDDDRVGISNLQRQVLYSETDLEQPKAIMAVARLQAMNSDCRLEAFTERFTELNAEMLAGECNLIIDASDNAATRYLIDRTSLALGIPWVYGSIAGWSGQSTVFGYGHPVRYPDLFPSGEAASEEVPPAVIGALPGTVGAMMATEAIKILLGRPTEETLSGRLLLMDLLHGESRTIRY
ncbi:thiamine biosynthesis protein ThiF [Porphyromonas gulae]|nr:thiamine biosynthesis protein ThiF [Porphyromonas gulae]